MFLYSWNFHPIQKEYVIELDMDGWNGEERRMRRHSKSDRGDPSSTDKKDGKSEKWEIRQDWHKHVRTYVRLLQNTFFHQYYRKHLYVTSLGKENKKKQRLQKKFA